MDKAVTTGLICLDDKLGFRYNIAKIEYTEYKDETFKYIFTPNYSVIDLLPATLYQGIPGLNMDLRKSEYVRENRIPVFISERTPSKNRVDLWELLEQCNMDYLNQLEWLIRTDTRYSGDNFYVIRYEDLKPLNIHDISDLGTRSAEIINKLLTEICIGNTVITDSLTINDTNRKDFYFLLMSLYKKEKKYIKEQKIKGIKKSAEAKKYKGRTPIDIDDIKLNEIFYLYKSGNINADEAAKRLNISRATFYRRYKNYNLKADNMQ